MVCRACSRDAPPHSRYCPACGLALDPLAGPAADSIATAFAERDRSPSSSSSAGRFVPGTVVGGRYRIVSLLGRGGMGEVYRADDLRVGQTVALKFLPDAVRHDEDRLRRLMDEVRIARQVAHGNVCRVYDVGETDGQPFLSMEYVDGEDLASLLRRIGRFPRDKAVQIAKQICAGLAAAHDLGIVHSDLKPSNVLIDGRGRARLADFGLARPAEGGGDGARAGTPAYMAPEQLVGEAVTAKTDLYALGLVLHELFTGKPAPRGGAGTEPTLRAAGAIPVDPSRLDPDLDPAVAQVILRCLQRDPARRPASALTVAAALPGGDPLAAALAAGETPDPELVAQAGDVDAIRPVVAWFALAAAAVALSSIVVLAGKSQLSQLVDLEKPPQVLAERAQEIVRGLGYADPPLDRATGLWYWEPYLAEIARTDSSRQRWDRLRGVTPSAVHFWYRQSPTYLVRWGISPRGNFWNPPNDQPGMIRMELDPRGNLHQFEAVPPGGGDAPTGRPWAPLFGAAGLDTSAFQRAEPLWIPPRFADARAAWTGTYPGTDVAIRVEAAVFQGRPTFFRVVQDWEHPPAPAAAARASPWVRFSQSTWVVVYVVILVAGGLLARRSLRLGRAHRRGATRLAVYLFVVQLLAWLVNAHHVPTQSELGILIGLIGRLMESLYFSSLVWVFYIALEPYLRRLWPRTQISWVRLLDGGLRDPLVGRDGLAGALTGMVLALLAYACQLVPGILGFRPPRPDDFLPAGSQMTALIPRYAFGLLFDSQRDVIFLTTAYILCLVVLRLLLRRQWLALAVWCTIGFVLEEEERGYVHALYFGLSAAVILLAFFRFGLLAATVALFVESVLETYPMTLKLSAWYAPSTLVAFGVVLGLTLYCLRIATAGRPMFRDPVLPE
jgi:serine/threonine-protein kinase